MTRLALITTIAALALPGVARAEPTFTGPLASYMTRVEASAHVPMPPGPINVAKAECPGHPEAWGCTNGVEIWMPFPDRFSTLHILGHIYDHNAMTASDRRAVRRAMGKTRWMPNEFADAYALCGMWHHVQWRVGHGQTRSHGVYYSGWQPTEPQHRRVCTAIRRTAPHGLRARWTSR